MSSSVRWDEGGGSKRRIERQFFDENIRGIKEGQKYSEKETSKRLAEEYQRREIARRAKAEKIKEGKRISSKLKSLGSKAIDVVEDVVGDVEDLVQYLVVVQ